MQVTYLDPEQAACVLEEAYLLARIEAPGEAVTHVLHWCGLDVLMMTDASTRAAVLVEPDVVDPDRGGSVHQQARLAFPRPRRSSDDVGS